MAYDLEIVTLIVFVDHCLATKCLYVRQIASYRRGVGDHKVG